MHKKYTNKLFCFSPPVMIATFLTEICLLIYTVWRYRFNRLSRLVAGMLLLLAIFQLAEYNVCTGRFGLLQWSRLGFVAITLLPPLGIHIIHTIKGKKHSPFVYMGYLIAAVFVLNFAFSANSLNGHQCLGNYVLFQVNPHLGWMYGLYYYGLVAAGLLMSLQFARQTKEKRQRQALYGFAFGYAAFLIPTTTAALLDKATIRGIPSIMCGFAVIFAIVAAVWVMPRASEPKELN
ncbi:MAG TPA: histidine kinase N-terminal 7TM domain-containing protein [Patescibacteria group bacterium]|nr:histidine kinase N-terminal 7TM domain-containing protein [Patescibacteria group bacterium]